MILLPEPLTFEWDEGNVSKSFLKHGIIDNEAEEIFVHRPLLLFDDEVHSASEKRYKAFGETESQKLLFTVFTVRKNKIRIISIRMMDKKERRIYEQAKKSQKDSGI